MQTKRGGPKSASFTTLLTRGLPGARRETRTRSGGRARTRDGTVGALRDREVVVRLRVADDLVRVGRGAGDVHLTGRGANVQAGVRRVRALGVVLFVGVAGLDLRHHVARVGLGRGVLTLRTLAEERRQRDRGQDADDQDDNEELDKGETALRCNSLTDLPQHVGPPSRSLVVRAATESPSASPIIGTSYWLGNYPIVLFEVQPPSPGRSGLSMAGKSKTTGLSKRCALIASSALSSRNLRVEWPPLIGRQGGVLHLATESCRPPGPAGRSPT